MDVVDVQASRWNEPLNQSFAVNLGVLAPSIYRITWQKEPPTFARNEDCLVRRRLSGGLAELPSGEQKDRWWTIRTAAEIERVGTEVAGLLATSGIPFFDRIDSLTTVRDVLEKDAASKSSTPLARIYLAVVLTELGDPESGQRMLENVASAASGAWSERVSAVLEELSRRTG